MKIQKQCMVCKENHIIEMTDKAYGLWRQGEHIQDIAPDLTIDERELLISGVCGKCFDEMFAEEEE